MGHVLTIAAGGALGALARYWLATAVYAVSGQGFPWGTLVVNVLGSLCMGVLFVFFNERMDVSNEVRAAVLIGFLGAFTTFSTFSIETLNLLEGGEHLRAFSNVVLSVVACVGACWVGVVAARQL